MTITNAQSGTNVHEISAGVYRISTPVECGSLNEWLAVAPQAQAVCGTIAALTSVEDLASRAPIALADGVELSLGSKRIRWLDAPHLPHNWECGYLFEITGRTLLCGDLFTHAGGDVPALVNTDRIGPAEAMRQAMPASVAIEKNARALLEKLARTEPATLALMHGSSFQGDGAKQLRGLADAMLD